nr:MAG TPA: hypothetical protein [Caudoviricetes sp.]
MISFMYCSFVTSVTLFHQSYCQPSYRQIVTPLQNFCQCGKLHEMR